MTRLDHPVVTTLSRCPRRNESVIQSNDSREFDLAAAYDAHAPAMLGFAINALRDRALAEDCVQETFLRAWRARTTFDPAKGGLRTWLFTIERNVITDALRSIQRIPVLSDDVADRAVIADSAPATVERLRVIEALAHLSPEHRQVIVAVHLTGSSYADVAAATGVSVSTLRTRAFYALRALRVYFDGQDDR